MSRAAAQPLSGGETTPAGSNKWLWNRENSFLSFLFIKDF